jgi:hypothetical protein
MVSPLGQASQMSGSAKSQTGGGGSTRPLLEPPTPEVEPPTPELELELVGGDGHWYATTHWLPFQT